MIFVGYQGIGKSTLGERHLSFLDLESSYFRNPYTGERPDDWYILYCQLAKHFSSQGRSVFTSSHKVVRDYLVDHTDEQIVCIYPALELKDDWLKRLRDRYSTTHRDKDLRAWKNAEAMYESNIRDLMAMEGVGHIVLTDINYCLATEILKYKMRRPLDA